MAGWAGDNFLRVQRTKATGVALSQCKIKQFFTRSFMNNNLLLTASLYTGIRRENEFGCGGT